MNDSDEHSGQENAQKQHEGEGKGSVPVMCCHPASRDANTTGEGQAPSTPVSALCATPRQAAPRRNVQRRMSIKRFFRVTPEEDARIVSRAAAVGLEPSSYLRVQALGETRLRRYRPIRADWDELRRCMGVINKAGNVVNQLVKFLYVGGNCSNVADTANHALAELIAAARAIMRALK